MSIAIAPSRITAVFAFGQWHEVEKGSFYLDAYELVEGSMGGRFFALGDYYPLDRKAHNGASWTGPDGQVSMPLFEIKAYREEIDDNH